MREMQETRFHPWVVHGSLSRKWPPASGSLPGKFHEQRSPCGLQSMGSQSRTWLITALTHKLIHGVELKASHPFQLPTKFLVDPFNSLMVWCFRVVKFEPTLSTPLGLKCGKNRSSPERATCGLYFEYSSGISELRCSSHLCFGLDHCDKIDTSVYSLRLPNDTHHDGSWHVTE